MQRFLSLMFSALLLTSPALALEADQSELLVLDPETFVRFDRTDSEKEVIQLFRVTDGQVDLIDAIQLNEIRVNFKKRFEYRRLKIDEKD